MSATKNVCLSVCLTFFESADARDLELSAQYDKWNNIPHCTQTEKYGNMSHYIWLSDEFASNPPPRNPAPGFHRLRIIRRTDPIASGRIRPPSSIHKKKQEAGKKRVDNDRDDDEDERKKERRIETRS